MRKLEAQQTLVEFVKERNFLFKIFKTVVDRRSKYTSIAIGANVEIFVTPWCKFAKLVFVKWAFHKRFGGQFEKRSVVDLDVVIIKLNRW